MWPDKGELQHYCCEDSTQMLEFAYFWCKDDDDNLKLHLDFCFYSQDHLVVDILRICPKTSLYFVGQHLQLDRRSWYKLFSVVGQYFYIRCSICRITFDHMYACTLFFSTNKFVVYFFFFCYTHMFKLNQKTITGK